MKSKTGTLVLTTLIAILAAALVLSAGCTGTTDSGTQETTAQTTAPTTGPTEPATPEETKETGEETADLSGTGNGKVTTGLAGGVHLLVFEQDKPDSGTIDISTEKDYISIPFGFNEKVADKAMKDGKYVWTQLFMIEDNAETNFDVTTDCSWNIETSFPEAINGIPPQTFTGTGNQATPFFQINAGTYNIAIKSENCGYTAVHLIDYYGNPLMEDDLQTPLAWHEGTYDDSVVMAVSEDNNYLFNVVCDGEWTVSIEESQV
ncbi:MAG: hypothetical protein JW931_05855 [Methanomicrobiaceae archaeon]|nr:hypothetical protein [Methanomicrobiaceae archaeon]